MRAKQWRQGVFVALLVLVALWLASLIMGLSGKAKIAMSEAHEVERKAQVLHDRKVLLEENLAALETARGKDAAIRTAFGVARPGEAVIVVVPPPKVTATSTPSWWERFLGLFQRD